MPHQKSLKWVLPEVVHPLETVCYQIEVPKDRAYIGAFLGAIFLLTKPYAWGDDDDHTALEVGAVWREIFDKLQKNNCTICPPGEPMGIDIGGAEMELRLKPDDPCIIQINCAGEWQDWYDPRGCLPGTISQPPPAGDLPPGGCREYDVVLQGNGQWRVPFGVNNGDIVTITDAQGGWYGGGVNPWHCPDGNNYVLGACAPATRALDGTDPCTSAYHMELIASFGGSCQAADNQVVLVSGLSGTDEMTFQANDSDLSDNAGSISFHVKICSGLIDCVNITYLLGANGPDHACIGDEFDYNVSVFDGVAWNGGIEFDHCCSLTLISQTGATVTSANWTDCGGTGHSGFNLTNIQEAGTNSTIGAFTLHLRLDAIVP